MDQDIPPYPLYNRTYSLYRLSPLHHGDDPPLLAAAALRAHQRRLRDQLTGDRVRGVDVDLARPDEIARLGPLADCRWELLGDDDAWIDRHRLGGDEDNAPPAEVRGIEVTLDYDTHTYSALLLRDPANPASTAPPGFSALPLLLLKMPGPVRDVFLHYLRTAFDAHVAPLALPSSFIAASLETYLRHLSADLRQLSIQLAFPATTTTLLKHIDITIAASDVSAFVARGKSTNNPFTTALSAYLAKHLALDLSHPSVHISRVSCNTLHLATDRLKLAAPDISDTDAAATQDRSPAQLAVDDFLTSLIREAAGTGRFLPEDLSARHGTPSSTASETTTRRKRAATTTLATTASATTASATNGKRPKSKSKHHDREDLIL